MPRKRKRNAGLSVKKKSIKHNQKQQIDVCNENKISILNIDDRSVNLDNDNSDILIRNSSSSSSSSSSRGNFNISNVIDTIDTEKATHIVSEYDNNQEEDAPIVANDFMLEMKLLKQMKQESHRWSIFNLFVFKYKGLSPPDDLDLYQYWIGRAGIASKIKGDLHLGRTYCVKERMLPIFEKILDCFKLGEKFRPSTVDNRGGNRQMTIKVDSYEAQIIADGMESGLSVRRVWENVNRHRQENSDDLVSESCIYYTLRKMRPKVVSISKRKQGSTDPGSNWAQARYAWTRQLLARFGRLERKTAGPIERKYDPDLQGKLSLHQIVWWDETHRKCLIGGQNPSKTIQMIFPRDKDGKIDIKNGEYTKERKTVLNVKYEKECRLGLGVAMVAPLSPDGTALSPIGRRCHPFDYSSKVMISIDDYQRMKTIEINRVKSLKGRNGYWISSSRDKDIKYYNDDPVLFLKGVGKKASQLLQEIGIKTIGELKSIKINEIDNLPKGLNESKLTKFRNEAQLASNHDAPKTIDHRVSSNPYESKFGADWEKHLQSSPTFSHSSYICNYISHMMSESERVMKGTVHENTWKVYHDALSIMTSKATKEWMQDKGYLDRWILPSNDLYDNLPSEARRFYEGKPVGNSPEFMPLDTHLNQDLHSSHDYHATVTQHLEDDDPRKFHGSTPKRMSDSYHRLFHPDTGVAPSSSRIMEDVSRVFHSLDLVNESEGCMIDENNRSGRRYEKYENKQMRSGWGGKRKKNTQDEYSHQLLKSNKAIHKDAMEILQNKDDRMDNTNRQDGLPSIVGVDI